MKQTTINGNQYSYPTSWNEMSYRVFAPLYYTQKDMNLTDSKLISILTGAPHKDVLNWIEPDEFIKICKDLTGFNGLPDWDNKPPKTITFRGKEYEVKDKAEKFPVQLFEDMRARMSTIGTKTTHDLEIWPEVVSMWVTWLIGEYDLEKSKEYLEDVKDMPAGVVVVLGNFFLHKSLNSLKGTRSVWRRIFRTRKLA